MEINDFSSLLSIVASISIAFVAVEYAKNYAKNLYETVFRFEEFFKKTFNKCYEVLPDSVTMDNLTPTSVGSNNTGMYIEKMKRDREIIHSEIQTFRKEKMDSVCLICQVVNISGICFFLFVSSIFILFLGAMEAKFPFFTHNVTQVFCLFSSLYLFIGWVLNFLKKGSCLYSSVFYVSIVFLALMSLSIFLSFLEYAFFIRLFDFWWWGLLTYVFLSFLNFVILVVFKFIEVKKIKKEVSERSEEIHKKCLEVKKGVDRITVTMNFAAGT